MAAIDQPILTDIYEEASSFVPVTDSAYIFMRSVEERSGHIESWRDRASATTFVEVAETSNFEVTALVSGRKYSVMLRSSESLASLWSDIHASAIYIDMTGFAHHVWAPLLRAALISRRDVMVVYVEPSDYKHSAAPIEGQIFDLSERIEGIAPLPGFAFLGATPEADTLFVPLLGFEGTRFSYLLEQVQPNIDRVIPIVGVPGFKLEYPFHTYQGNKRPLEQTGSWRRVRFATANCPFSLFYLLEELARLHPRSVLQVAPIGTKPHALGAILFKIVSSRAVEIVYDFPLRKSGRTRGSDRLLVYYVSAIGAG